MIKKLTLFLIFLLLVPLSLSAEDIEVFECTTNVKPNVLFLFDTSASMRKHSVYASQIPAYDHNRTTWGNHSSDEPYKLWYKESESDPLWKRFGWWSEALINFDSISYWKDLKPAVCTPEDQEEGLIENYCSLCSSSGDCSNCNAKEQIWKNGHFDGYLNQYYGDCSNNTPSVFLPPGIYLSDRLVVTKNYINYMAFVDDEMERIRWDTPATMPSGLTDYDLETYNPNRDYYNYYGDGLGYGDYKVEYDLDSNGCLKDENDIVYLNLLQADADEDLLIRKFKFGIAIDNILCDDAKEDLQNYGWTKSKVQEVGISSLKCKWYVIKKLLMTANFLNYIDMQESRRYNGINAVWDVLKSRYNGDELEARFGLMQFDYNWNILWANLGGDLSVPCGASPDQMTRFKEALFGRFDHKSATDTYGQPLNFGSGKIDILKGTPIAESLIEAGLYFAGQNSWFNTYPVPDDFFNNTVDYTTTDAEQNYDAHQAATTSGTCKYRSPILCSTQKNHIVLITDGAPTYDISPKIKNEPFYYYNSSGGITSRTIGNYDPNDGDNPDDPLGSIYQFWADDVAKFLNDSDNIDFSPLDNPQNILTHVITFMMHADEGAYDGNHMASIASNGGTTVPHTARDKGELQTQINEILKGVLMSGTFSSAVTPVRQDDLIYSGNTTFLTSFQIGDGTRGTGNIKQYKRDGDKIKGIDDRTDLEADLMTASGSIVPGIRDLWGVSVTDLNEKIPTEGVAYKLWKRIADLNAGGLDIDSKLLRLADERKIYSSFNSSGSKPVRSILDLAFSATDNIVIKTTSGDTMTGNTLKTFLTNAIYGYGLDWPLGDITHSDIVVTAIPDATDPKNIAASYMFAGANDGMLHCFNVETGREEWTFIPPDFLGTSKLAPLGNNYHGWYVDGGITIFSEMVYFDQAGQVTTNPDEIKLKVKFPKYLIFGERRGGNYYHILNIRDIATTNKPDYIKGISDNDSGQSWSNPRLCQVMDGDDKKTGFLVGGGYDERYDDRSYEKDPSDLPKGRYLAIYDITDGTLIGDKIGSTGVGKITDSVVAARINDIDHDADRVFSTIVAGDLGGNVYRYNADGSGNWSGYKLFSCPEATSILVPDPDVPNATKSVSVPQKIFYAPVINKNPESNKNMVFFGTGDRENPKEYEVNGIYGVEDHPTGGLLPEDLTRFNLTAVFNGADQNNGKVYTRYSLMDLTNVESPKGWYFNLPDADSGEKVISEPIVLGNILIMATNIPVAASADEAYGPCQSKGCDSGTGRVYIINTLRSNFSVKSFGTGTTDPMPQPKIVFDKDSGKVLVSTGDGGLYDPGISVLNGLYWKNNANE